MAMLGNLVALLENVALALGGKMTIIEILFTDLKKSSKRLFWANWATHFKNS